MEALAEVLNWLAIVSGFIGVGAGVVLRWAREPSKRREHAVGVVVVIAAIITSSSAIFQRQEQNEAALRQRQFQDAIQIKTNEIRAKADENLKLGSQLNTKSDDNIRLSNKVTQLANDAISTVTGGNSFCYIHVLVRDDGLYPVVLSRGQYPVYDVTLRLWDPDEWKNQQPGSTRSLQEKVTAETSRLGTIAERSYIDLSPLPLPSGVEKEYAAEFSARNGSWLQTIVLRRRPGDPWKVATLVRKYARVVKFAELNEVRPVLCYERDPDFPETSPGELIRAAGHAPHCSK